MNVESDLAASVWKSDPHEPSGCAVEMVARGIQFGAGWCNTATLVSGKWVSSSPLVRMGMCGTPQC